MSRLVCNFLSFDIVAIVCNDEAFVNSSSSLLRISVP